MSDVSHGVNAGKTDSGAITPVSVDTGVHFVVGTAPVQATNGKVNEVIMASSYAEATTGKNTAFAKKSTQRLRFLTVRRYSL